MILTQVNLYETGKHLDSCWLQLKKFFRELMKKYARKKKKTKLLNEVYVVREKMTNIRKTTFN